MAKTPTIKPRTNRRSSKAKINLDNYEYYANLSGIAAIDSQLTDLIFGIGGNRALLSPIRRKVRPRITLPLTGFVPMFLRYGEILGFRDEKSKPLLAIVGRGILYHRLFLLITYLIVAPILIMAALALREWLPITIRASTRFMAYAIAYALTVVIMFFLYYMIIFITFRLASILADRDFAEALCVAQSFYIVIELEQDDVLLIPSKKRWLLNSIDYLARKVLLMSLNYSSSDTGTKKWSKQHFTKIEKYIRERERWAVAPQSKTLQLLRRDFYELAGVFLTGNYGAVDWAKSVSALQEDEQSNFQKIMGSFLRFIGIAIPIGLIAAMILVPNFHTIFGVPNTTISLIALAWLLLAIDANLKLGVVERLVDLAKAVKQL